MLIMSARHSGSAAQTLTEGRHAKITRDVFCSSPYFSNQFTNGELILWNHLHLNLILETMIEKGR